MDAKELLVFFKLAFALAKVSSNLVDAVGVKHDKFTGAFLA